jgi:hypothetical protein
MKTPLGPNSKDLAVALGTDEDASLKNIVPLAAFTSGCLELSAHSECEEAILLASIERALTKLRNNTFGICVSCGADIRLAKLDYDPTTEECDDCEGCHVSSHSTLA